MRQKASVNLRGRLALAATASPGAAPMQHAGLEVEPSRRCRRNPLEAEDGAGPRARIDADQQKAGDMGTERILAGGADPAGDLGSREPIIDALGRRRR